MCVTKFLMFLENKKSAVYFCLIFLSLIVISTVLGQTGGWFNEIIALPVIPFQPYSLVLQLKPITLLLFSFLGLTISILLLLKNFIERIPHRARLTIALFCVIPEAVYFNEFFFHYFFWAQNNLVIESYFDFHTKISAVVLFSFVALQIILLFSNHGQTKDGKQKT